MGTGTATRIVQQAGALYFGVTSLTAANFGGTCLGHVRDIEFRFPRRSVPLTAGDDFGGSVVDVLDCGDDCIVAGVLRGWDPDAIGQLFPNTSTGTSSGDRVVKGAVNGTNRSGRLEAASAVKLLYAPTDVERGLFVVVFKAIPLIDESAAMRLNLSAEVGIPFAFYGVPDTATGSTKATYQFGRKSDISLTPP